MLKQRKGKVFVWGATVIVFVILNAFSLYVYKNAGVVRDIPELEVSKTSPQRGMWAEYNDRIFVDDKPFVTDKKHWLIIGNSFARDFANMVYESAYADKIEVSYIEQPNYMDVRNEKRFSNADKIFVASKDYSDELIHNIELLAMAFGHNLEDVIVVGEKYFGETMTQVYARRFYDDYYQTELPANLELNIKNNQSRELYGDRFINLMSMTEQGKGKIRVFTDNGMFISSDCVHLTRAGAEYFAQRIEWIKYFN